MFKTKPQFWGLFLVLIVSLTNCSRLQSVSLGNEQFSETTEDKLTPILHILETQCLSCHSTPSEQNAGIGLSSLDMMIQTQAIIPGNLDRSVLFQVLLNNQMPPDSNSLSQTDIERIAEWIALGAPDQNGSPINQVPRLDAGPDQVISSNQMEVTVQAESNDLDGEIVKIYWEQLEGPNVAQLSGSRSLILKISSLVVGEYLFQVTVEDNKEAIQQDQITIKVTDP